MKAINWGGEQATDPRFLTIVKKWIETDGEIYVRIYHGKAGGAADHFYFNAYPQFVRSVNSTWGDCSIEVYRQPHFPLRGIITEAFISTAKKEFANNEEWFLLILEKYDDEWKTIHVWGGNTHGEFDEELRGFQGKYALIGPDIHSPISPDDYPGEWIQGDFDRYSKKDEISGTFAD